MQTALQITFRDIPQSDALETRIREKAEKLEEFHPGIVSCRVVVESRDRHKHQGKEFCVRIEMHIPQHDIAINRDHHEDVYVAVRDAFNAAAAQAGRPDARAARQGQGAYTRQAARGRIA